MTDPEIPPALQVAKALGAFGSPDDGLPVVSTARREIPAGTLPPAAAMRNELREYAGALEESAQAQLSAYAPALAPGERAALEPTAVIPPQLHVSFTAAQVLDQHVGLFERLRYPNTPLTDYMETYAGDMKRTGREAAQSFYPYYDPDHLDPHWAADYCKHVAASLFTARTYQVTADMMRVVNGIYRKSLDHIAHLDEREMPSPAGFLWLDEPFLAPDLHHKLTTTRVITWSLQPVRVQDPVTRQVDSVPGVRLVFWSLWGDFSEYEHQIEEKIPLLRRSLGDLSMAHAMVLPFGQRFGTWRKDDEEIDPEGNVSDMGNLTRVLWTLLGSEIPSVRKAALDRHTVRRAVRSIRQGEVSVITLRRMVTLEDGGDYDPREVDWTCRWLVQGHWRHLESYDGPRHAAHDDGGHCTACGARVTWVKPYLKGPEDKPLKSTEHVYRLSR